MSLIESSATDLLRADHRKIENLLDRLLALAKPPARDMGPAVSEVMAELRRLTQPHFQREEGVLYPYLRTFWPDLLAEMDEQHAYAREVEQNLDQLLAQLDGAPTQRQFTELVRFSVELHDAIQHHIVAEEEQLLQLADDRLSSQEQSSLAARMGAAA